MERLAATIDNKNLMEDFAEDTFPGFYAAADHMKGGMRHLVGCKTSDSGDGMVDVRWRFGDNCIRITLLAVPAGDDWKTARESIFGEYRKVFGSWECEDNPHLMVEFYELCDTLSVIFYFGGM